jgi:hypothetical protein
MAHSVLSALARIKIEVAECLSREMIDRLCRDVNYYGRRCVLDPFTTVQLFLLQVLHGNTACDHVPHLAGLDVTGEAYCKARARLPVELFQRLLVAVCAALSDTVNDAERWRGHRVWHMDGSGCSMPDTPELQAAFGQPGGQAPGCGFPVAHLMTLFHAGTGLLQRIVTAPLRTHDMAQAHRMHDLLEPGDVLVADRGFCSYTHLALLAEQGVFAVFRVHQQTIVSFRKGRASESPARKSRNRGRPSQRRRRATGRPYSRWVRWLGTCDQIVEAFRPVDRPNWITPEAFAALPVSLHVRELRYRVTQPGYRTREITLVTTLLDAERYPAAELAALYGQRWEIETNLGHLKQTLRMDVLRTKTVDGIHKELAMYALVYNLIRLVMLQSGQQQNVAATRISFIDAQRWLCHTAGLLPHRKLIVLPHRAGRIEPRVRKRRPKSFPLMTKPRAQLRQTLLAQ